MNGLEEVYLTWLCDKIAIEYGRETTKTYWDLLGQLHAKEFVWVVPNDDNRISDGVDLRNRFLSESGFQKGPSLAASPVSVLEVIIALAGRLEFITGLSSKIWVWRLIENLELHKMSDPVTSQKRRQIDDKLEGLIWRTYSNDGFGGLFPLAFPKADQRKEEIWYQMHHFLEEQPPDES